MIRLPQRPVTRAAALSVAMTVVFGGIQGYELSQTHAQPLEHATVLGYERTGETAVCHKLRQDEYVVTFRSDDPPPGLPATFEHDGYCDPEPIGTVVPLVRVPSDDEVAIYPYPLRSPGEVALVLGGFSVLAFLIALASMWASRAYDAWRERRRERRRTTSTDPIG